MRARTLTLGALTVATFFAGAAAANVGVDLTQMPWDLVHCGDNPEEATDVFHDFQDPLNPALRVAVHLICYAESTDEAKPGGGGGGGCSSPAYNQLSYRWTKTYSARFDASNSGLSASGVGSAFDASGKEWDGSAAGTIWGGVTQGGNGADAGRQDGVNQFGFKRLGGSTIAQTTTWYFSSTGEAVESDGAYNTGFAWSLSGESNKMDLQNIATHEIGHTYGLGHPQSNSQNACLTMYAYADYGETQKRTLGTGDVNGIKAIYG